MKWINTLLLELLFKRVGRVVVEVKVFHETSTMYYCLSLACLGRLVRIRKSIFISKTSSDAP